MFSAGIAHNIDLPQSFKFETLDHSAQKELFGDRVSALEEYLQKHPNELGACGGANPSLDEVKVEANKLSVETRKPTSAQIVPDNGEPTLGNSDGVHIQDLDEAHMTIAHLGIGHNIRDRRMEARSRPPSPHGRCA